MLSLNIISLSICWIDYDFIEKSKSRPSLIADYSRSKDDGLRLILREDSSFEIFQTSNMLSSHSFNYGNFLIDNDTIYLHYRKEMSWGQFKNKNLGKLVLIETTESLYGKGYIKYLRDYQLNIELDYFRFDIIEKINTSP